MHARSVPPGETSRTAKTANAANAATAMQICRYTAAHLGEKMKATIHHAFPVPAPIALSARLSPADERDAYVR